MKGMKTLSVFLIGASVSIYLLIFGTGCHLLLPLQSQQVPGTPCYRGTADIYRPLGAGGEEFVEKYEVYIWNQDLNGDQQADAVDAMLALQDQLNDYVFWHMAPGLSWQTRNLTVTEVEDKSFASDCASTLPPPAYGGPVGAHLLNQFLNPSPGDRVSASVSLVDTQGNTRTATPSVKTFDLRFAERLGVRDKANAQYVYGQRNVRFTDIYIELYPFQLGDLSVEKCYLQSIGTVIAWYQGGGDYRIEPGDAKFFFYGFGTKGGESGATSFCFNNSFTPQTFRLQSSEPYFAIALNLTADVLQQDMQVKLNFNSPYQVPFQQHQPVVQLAGTKEASSPVDLAPQLDLDYDNDLAHYQWFENFESVNERFLGSGRTLTAVPFSAGDHEITLVAYDARGAYNADTMLLKVSASPPVASDDNYITDEDTPLYVSAPGILDNDSDPNGDPLTLSVVSLPAHGNLNLYSNGSFTYKPAPNFTGSDTFTYKVNDGQSDSGPATVTIQVVEVPEDKEMERIKTEVAKLFNAGALNDGQTESFYSKLDAAIQAYQKGKTQLACNLLHAFVNEVNGYVVSNKLSASQAQPLLDKANNIMDELGC